MEWLVTDKVEVEEVAVPALRLVVARAIAPSLKTTLPVGVPPAGDSGPTVAVKVTDWPKTEGLGKEVTVVALLALLTVWVTVAERFVLKLRPPGAVALTVAVRTTDWPETDGLPDETTAVVLLALLTV